MERCRDEVRARGLAERVVLRGARAHAFVIKRMRKAAVFAQHSITAPDGDTEGLPVVTADQRLLAAVRGTAFASRVSQL